LYDRIYFTGNRSSQIEKRAVMRLMAAYNIWH
jgi:hypothetical protein